MVKDTNLDNRGNINSGHYNAKKIPNNSKRYCNHFKVIKRQDL